MDIFREAQRLREASLVYSLYRLYFFNCQTLFSSLFRRHTHTSTRTPTNTHTHTHTHTISCAFSWYKRVYIKKTCILLLAILATSGRAFTIHGAVQLIYLFNCCSWCSPSSSSAPLPSLQSTSSSALPPTPRCTTRGTAATAAPTTRQSPTTTTTRPAAGTTRAQWSPAPSPPPPTLLSDQPGMWGTQGPNLEFHVFA